MENSIETDNQADVCHDDNPFAPNGIVRQKLKNLCQAMEEKKEEQIKLINEQLFFLINIYENIHTKILNT